MLRVWACVQAGLCQNFRHIINMEAIAHTGIIIVRLYNSDVTVTKIITGNCAIEDSIGNYFPSIQLHNFVTILCFFPISIVHLKPLSWV